MTEAHLPRAPAVPCIPPSIVTIGEQIGEVKIVPVFPRAEFEEEISSSRNPLEAGADATNCVGVPGGVAMSPGGPAVD